MVSVFKTCFDTLLFVKQFGHLKQLWLCVGLPQQVCSYFELDTHPAFSRKPPSLNPPFPTQNPLSQHNQQTGSADICRL